MTFSKPSGRIYENCRTIYILAMSANGQTVDGQVEHTQAIMNDDTDFVKKAL
jgi:hypothetical protein